MTAVVDIDCPECGKTQPVMKIGIDRYCCTACEVEFSHEDVLPEDR